MQYRTLTLAAAIAVANLLPAEPLFAAAISNLPPEETQGMATYRTGGIGQSEAEAMEAAESQYPLALEFLEHAKPKNAFLANVEVTIKDQHGGTVLRTYADGPFLLARLPDGGYTVAATEDGKTQTREVTLAAAKPERLVFTW